MSNAVYQAFFKLSGRPFQPGPDPDFYFASRGHSRALAYLKHGGLHHGEGFVVITGDIGSGKTTLIRTVLQEVDREKVTLGQVVSTRRDADDFLRSVCLAFGLPDAGVTRDGMLAAFEVLLRSLRERGRRALLIVDEAQNLTASALGELRILSDFQAGAKPLLQCFLVGQAELRETLRLPQLQSLRQRVAVAFHLGPLSKDEVGAYVLHRLKRAGWDGDPQIDAAIFDGLHRESGGVPRAINALFDRLLTSAYLSGSHALSPVDLDETVADIREEFGPGGGAAANEPAVPPPPSAEVIGLPTVIALMARFDRIDQAVATVYELLLPLVRTEEAGPQDAAGERRSRFGARFFR